MARRRDRYVDAPPRRDVYFGMLFLTAMCAVVGILLLYLETSEYSVSEPAQSPTVTLPNIDQLIRSGPTPAPAPNAGQPMNPMGGTE